MASLWREVLAAAARGGLDALQKAADGPPASGAPPFKKKPPGAGGAGPPGAGGGDSPFGPPPPPPPPARDLPEPIVGNGPTLAAPPQEQLRVPMQIPDMDPAAVEPKSLLYDPFAVVDAMGYKERNSQLTYETLHLMKWKMPIAHAMIKLRCDQVFAFARQQEDKTKTGFRVTLRDKKARTTPASDRYGAQLERWLLTTGTTKNPSARDSFGTFLKKVTEDSLTYDALCAEVVPSRLGKPAEFYAVDARTIRLADSTKLFVDPEDRAATRFVQVYDGLIDAEYSSDELIYGIRNPCTDIRNQGYGNSELEMLITIITAMLYGFNYNMLNFSQGTSAKGIINFKGAVPEKHLNGFREHWYAMTSGVENAHKTPITNAEELQFISMQQANKDMEFSAWFDFLIKICASIFGIDPIEINFKYGDTGASKPMFESNNNQKLVASKDKGLKPLLGFLELHLNQSLIWKHDEDFCLEFLGLEAPSEAEQLDSIKKKVTTYMTVDEARATEALAPLPNGLGNIILDAVFQQHLALAQQTQQQYDASVAAQQQPQQEGDGAEGNDGGQAPEDLQGDNSDGGGESVAENEAGPPPKEPKTQMQFGKSLRKGPPAAQPLVIEIDV